MDAHCDGCTYVLGLRIVVPTALRRPSGWLLRQRHPNALQTLRRLLSQLSRQRRPLVVYLFWTPAYFLIFAVRTCYRLRPPRSAKSHTGPSERKQSGHGPRRAVQTDAFILAKSHTILRKQAMAKSNKAKSQKRPFVGRGETWPPVLALGCLSGCAVCPFGLSCCSPLLFCFNSSVVLCFGLWGPPRPCSFPALLVSCQFLFFLGPDRFFLRAPTRELAVLGCFTGADPKDRHSLTQHAVLHVWQKKY